MTEKEDGKKSYYRQQHKNTKKQSTKLSIDQQTEKEEKMKKNKKTRKKSIKGLLDLIVL